MKKGILSLLLVASAAFVSFGFVPSDYKERTLTSWEFSIRSSKLFPKNDNGQAVDRRLTGLASEVEYTGRSRKLAPEKRALLGLLNVNAPYTHEIEVLDGGFPYWVAVQDPVFPHLSKELKAGENFRIYFHFAGVAKKQQPVYLMAEFDSSVTRN